MLDQLPDDIILYIKQYIKQIRSAIIIQNSYRRFMMRHCRKIEWRHIRHKIMKMTTFIGFKKLMDVKWIRNEWRTEPGSWVYMLSNSPDDLHTIIECDCGT